MAYSKAQRRQLLTKAIAQAKKHNLYFISDVIAYLPISRQTFYDWEFDDSDKLKEVLQDNKIGVKVALRKKWQLSDNATLNIALYKLVGSNKERRMLAERQEIKQAGSIEQRIRDMTDEEREKRMEILKKKLFPKECELVVVKKKIDF
ncbi:MAG: hypothetical protein IIC76_15925 [Bacteroidetes bacterium]|nr:hypothetical protein [Bacteroidota bacterium]